MVDSRRRTRGLKNHPSPSLLIGLTTAGSGPVLPVDPGELVVLI